MATSPDTASMYSAHVDDQIRAFVEEHREMMLEALDDLSEADVRRRLVPSRTTLLGLVKHATFVEKVWFQEALTGASREELGIEAGPDESFHLQDGDSIESVLAAYREAIAQSRAAVVGLSGDAILPGNRRGPLRLRWIQLHVLRELAQHCGHADILREQILAARETGKSNLDR